MRKTIAILMLLCVTFAQGQKIRADWFKVKNPIERTDFSNGYERIPLMQRNGKIKGFIHSDSLALKSDLLNLGKTYEAGDGITIINDTINNDNYFQFFQKNYPSPAFGSVEFGIGTTGNESTIGISRTIGGLPRFNLKNITVINGVNTENLILKNLNISSANVTSSKTVTFQDKAGVVALTSDIKDYQAGTNISIDNTNPLQPIINSTVDVSNYVPYTGADKQVELNSQLLSFYNGRVDGDANTWNNRYYSELSKDYLSIKNYEAYGDTEGDFIHLNSSGLKTISGDYNNEYTGTTNGTTNRVGDYTANFIEFSTINEDTLNYIEDGDALQGQDAFKEHIPTYTKLYSTKLIPDFAKTQNVLLKLPDSSGTIAKITDIPIYQAGSNITIDSTNPLQPIINASSSGSSGSSGTDLGVTTNSDTVTVTSSSGNDVVLPLATTTTAGLQKSNFYQEGEFTPAFRNSNGGNYNIGASYSRYVRIGNIVHVYIRINSMTNGTVSNVSGSFYMSGIPFPVSVFADQHMASLRVDMITANYNNSTSKEVLFFQPAVSNEFLLNDINFNAITGIDFGTVASGVDFIISGTYKTNVYTP